MDVLARVTRLAAANGLAFTYAYVEGEHHCNLDDGHDFFSSVCGDDESVDIKLSYLERTLSAYLNAREVNHV